jgi:hypothetical protein
MSSAQFFSEGIEQLSSEKKKELRALQNRLRQLASPNPPGTRRTQRIPPNQQRIIRVLNNLPIVGELVIPDAENYISYEPISDNDEIFILHGLKQYPYTKDSIIKLLFKKNMIGNPTNKLEPEPLNPFTREPITLNSITKYILRHSLNNKTIGGRKKLHKKSHKTHKKSRRN